MKTIRLFILILTLIGFLGSTLLAQPNPTFRRTITFPPADTARVRPFLCTTDASGNLWVISSTTTDTTAHNALWKAGPNDNVMAKAIDYTAAGDPIMHSLRGITALGNDIYVVLRQVGTIPVSAIYRYRDGDPRKKESFGFGLGQVGYGTLVFGLAATRDTFLYAGTTFEGGLAGPTPRVYNFTSRTITNSVGESTPGSFIRANDPFWGYISADPGGKSPAGVDAMRDIAVIPNGDYSKPSTPFFTARNSSEDNPTSGNVAIWWGGTQIEPKTYKSVRASDFFAELALGRFIPYGITADNVGRLYIAGGDSARRWIKVFEVDTSGSATAIAEFPSQTNPSNPNPNGAPFVAPCDVALSPDLAQAYVIDQFARKVFVFSTGLTAVEDVDLAPGTLMLHQNYPNPFNPSTVIGYSLPVTSHVTLKVYDLLGREIATLVDEEKEAGNHEVNFDTAPLHLTSGVYVYRLKTTAGFVSRRMMLVK